MNELKEIISKFNISEAVIDILPFGSGHINDTYKVETEEGVYLLQRINHQIFKKPNVIQRNMIEVSEYLESGSYPYPLLKPIKAGRALSYKNEEGNYWRVLPFITNSYTIDQVNTPRQALKAAMIFGEFDYHLSNLRPELIKETIPNFHNAKSRWQEFEKALQKNKAKRKKEHQEFINEVLAQKELMFKMITLQENGLLPVRIVHNDTKINNILFDNDSHRVKAVIDWDTIMPGTVLSDFGDMVRSYTNTAAEDEKNVEIVNFDLTIFQSIVEGFLIYGKDFLEPIEIENLVNSALWITYEQVIRFLGDFLNGDVYYKVHYADHNLVRAKNQFSLLCKMLIHRETMKDIVFRLL